MTYIELAKQFLEEHYPDKEEPTDVKWSAVYNFAEWLENQLKIKVKG